jgi:hypothetical protein
MSRLLSGAGEGRLLAQEFLAKQKQQNFNNQRIANRDYQDQLNDEQTREIREFNLRKQSYEFKLAQEQEARAKQERSLFAMAFNSNASMKEDTTKNTLEGTLSEKYLQIGKQLMGIDPTKGMEYVGKAQSLKQQVAKNTEAELSLKAARIQARGDVAATVFDEESAMEATKSLAELGVVVPEKYRNYSPEAKEWWKNQSMMSANYSKLVKAENDSLRTLSKTQQDQLEREKFEFKKAESIRKEELNRSRIALSADRVKGLTKEERITEVGALSSADPRIKDLDKEVRSAMAQDVYSIANALKVESGGSLSTDEALKRARQEVISRIKEDGTYPLVSTNSKRSVTKEQLAADAILGL